MKAFPDKSMVPDSPLPAQKPPAAPTPYSRSGTGTLNPLSVIDTRQ